MIKRILNPNQRLGPNSSSYITSPLIVKTSGELIETIYPLINQQNNTYMRSRLSPRTFISDHQALTYPIHANLFLKNGMK